MYANEYTISITEERSGNKDGKEYQRIKTEIGGLWNNTNPFEKLYTGSTYDVIVLKGGIKEIKS